MKRLKVADYNNERQRKNKVAGVAGMQPQTCQPSLILEDFIGKVALAFVKTKKDINSILIKKALNWDIPPHV